MASQPYSLNALKRWSANDATLPPVSKIKRLHIYDFDNTLFNSPLPNRSLWSPAWLGRLQNTDAFVNGGWWHDAGLLAATGQGIDVEEPRAWKGHWNEKIVELAHMSDSQDDTLSVLLTGRGERKFSELIQRIAKSRDLKFDMFMLKPAVGPSNETFSSTMAFKQQFLSALMNTYREADEIRIYEDRPKHVVDFRGFLERFNRELRLSDDGSSRAAIDGEVIEVTELPSALDPIAEASEVQRMVNAHNQAILSGSASVKIIPLKLQKTVLYTAYQVTSPKDNARLLNLVNPLPKGAKRLANSIFIHAGKANDRVLRQAGGLGTTLRLQATEVGYLDNRVWAARVNSTSGQRPFSVKGPPTIVLAVNGFAKPIEVKQIRNWKKLPQENMLQFEAKVSEVFRLDIVEEHSLNRGHKRQCSEEGEYSPEQIEVDSGHDANPAPRPQHMHARGGHSNGRGRGGVNFRNRNAESNRGGFRGRGANNHRGGRGRGFATAPGRANYTDYDAQGGPKATVAAGVGDSY